MVSGTVQGLTVQDEAYKTFAGACRFPNKILQTIRGHVERLLQLQKRRSEWGGGGGKIDFQVQGGEFCSFVVIGSVLPVSFTTNVAQQTLPGLHTTHFRLTHVP